MNGLHWEFVLGCATLSPRNHIAVTNAIATCLCSEATSFFLTNEAPQFNCTGDKDVVEVDDRHTQLRTTLPKFVVCIQTPVSVCGWF